MHVCALLMDVYGSMCCGFIAMRVMDMPTLPSLLAVPLSGELDKASSHLEVFRELSYRHRWHTESGDSLYEIACEHLRRVYTSLAERVSTSLLRYHPHSDKNYIVVPLLTL